MPRHSKRHRFALRGLALVAGLLIATPVLSAPCKTSARAKAEVTATIQAMNTQRRAAGLPQLHQSAKLSRVALSHACDNAARGVYSHVGSDGSDLRTRLHRVGYTLRTAAENTGIGFATYDRAVSFWMHSPHHRNNILNASVTEVGVALVDGARPNWVVVFGRPR